MRYHVEFEQWVAFPLKQVFRFFANPQNLPRIMPPTLGTAILQMRLVPPPGTEASQNLAGEGSEIVTSFRLLPGLPLRAEWTAQITEFAWDHHFADIQKEGPFRWFQHRHEFEGEARAGQAGTLVRDIVDYDPGWGALGTLGQKLLLARQLEKTFLYRQARLETLLAASPGPW
jgi:ligand-binding SRPBCC domain-containing protein